LKIGDDRAETSKGGRGYPGGREVGGDLGEKKKQCLKKKVSKLGERGDTVGNFGIKGSHKRSTTKGKSLSTKTTKRRRKMCITEGVPRGGGVEGVTGNRKGRGAER